MSPSLNFHNVGELAQHFVILGDLLVVAAIRHIGEQLRQIADQVIPLGRIGLTIQNPEICEGPHAFTCFGHDVLLG